VISGPSLSDLVGAENADLDSEMQTDLSMTMRRLGQIKTAAEGGMPYDQMLARGNKGGEALIMGGVNALIAQTKTIERVVATLGLENVAFEGSDSLDAPGAVFK
jgi:putative iron-regulated protein